MAVMESWIHPYATSALFGVQSLANSTHGLIMIELKVPTRFLQVYDDVAKLELYDIRLPSFHGSNG